MGEGFILQDLSTFPRNQTEQSRNMFKNTSCCAVSPTEKPIWLFSASLSLSMSLFIMKAEAHELRIRGYVRALICTYFTSRNVHDYGVLCVFEAKEQVVFITSDRIAITIMSGGWKG